MASEVATVLQKHGINIETSKMLIADIIEDIAPFTEKEAFLAASLYQQSSKLGLSLGDRACLSTALLLDRPVLTADKVWTKLKLDISIKLIR